MKAIAQCECLRQTLECIWPNQLNKPRWLNV